MSSFSRLVVISLLCLLISLSTLSFAAGRHIIGVVNKKERESKDLTTSQSVPKMSRDDHQTLPITKQNKNIPSQVAINGTTLLNDDKKTKVKVEEKTRQVSKNTHNINNNNAQESSKLVVNRHERQDHIIMDKLPDHSKQMKTNKFRQTTVTWRVPRKKKDVPDTGFFLDYAPPKVHPPSHN